MILKPNETAIYRKSTGILSMHINANAQNEISWREGVLSFNDISMGKSLVNYPIILMSPYR